MSDLVGNPEDRFSHNEAHLKVECKAMLRETKNLSFLIYHILVFILNITT